MTSLYTRASASPSADLAIGSDVPRLDPDHWPGWARAHIPVDDLVESPHSRRSRSRSRLLPSQRDDADDAPTATDLVDDLSQLDEDELDPHPYRNRPRRSRSSTILLIGFSAVALIAAAAAGAGITLLTTGGDATPALVLADPPAATESVIPSAPELCMESVDGDVVTTSGPGNTSSAAGVIAAFDYAYYTERDGGRVSELMVNPPNTVAVIQEAIDAVPVDTRACVTTSPTSDPLVFAVDVTLRAPDRPDGAMHQLITVARSGSTFKIARVEDR